MVVVVVVVVAAAAADDDDDDDGRMTCQCATDISVTASCQQI